MTNANNPSVDSRLGAHNEKKYSAILWMVCFYLFLTIERPWESISYLYDVKIEKFFAIIMLIAAFACGRLKLRGVATVKWVLLLLALHFMLAPFAYITSAAIDQGIEYAKMVVLYVLILSCCDDETDLRLVVKAFVIAMALYVLHSYSEFLNGRHTYRMGIVRMMGVGETFSDPNTFAASIVLSLPFVWVVFKAEISTWKRWGFIAYGLLGVMCIILTGSRSGMLALLLLVVLTVLAQKGALRWKLAAFMVVSILIVWPFMPEDKQERIRSVWDENAGPVNAHASTHGRSLGYHAGLEMFSRKPLTGVGAGSENFIAYRTAHVDGIPEQAHNLIGEVLGEFGLPGAIAFVGLIISTLRLLWKTRRLEREQDGTGSYLHRLSGAGLVTVLLLIFLGFGGHNFYRPLWLWVAAWSSLAYLFACKSSLRVEEMADESTMAISTLESNPVSTAAK